MASEEELVASFNGFEEDVTGPGRHERLHRMIETLGPRLAPYASEDLPR